MRVKITGWMVVALLAACCHQARAQSCSPGRDGPFPQGTINFEIAAAFGNTPARSHFIAAANEWAGQIRRRGGNINFTYDQGGGIPVGINSSNPGWWGLYDPQAGTLQFNVKTLEIGASANNLFDQSVFFHEVGEVLGYGHTMAYWGCSPSSSVMFESITESQAYSGDFASWLTSADRAAITRDIGGAGDPDEPPTDRCRVAENCTPLLLNLAGQRIRLSEPEVPFDFFGDGHRRLFSWPFAGDTTGFLVLDRNNNGQIDDGRELFGNATPLSWSNEGEPASNGFVALAWFDTPAAGGDGDGAISSDDAVFHSLRLWFDWNRNGIGDPDELVSLEDAAVERIFLSAKASGHRDAYGNVFRWRADVTMRYPDAEKRVFIYDVLLVTATYR